MKKLFTIIELIVVIVVIGILASIVLPNVGDQKESATKAAITGNIRNLQTSVDMYGLKNSGELPGVQEVSSFKPQPIDFDKIKPSELRNLPKTKDVKYWVDFWGTVWGGTADAPKITSMSGGELKWENTSGSTKYRIYEIVGYEGSENVITANVSRSTHIKLADETTENISTKVEIGKAYIVSSIDALGFESAPAGVGYEGYEAYMPSNLDNPDTTASNYLPFDLSSFAKVTYVDPLLGNDANDGSKEKPLKTVNKAFNVAVNNQAIVLSKGNHLVTSQIRYDKSLSIIGQGEETLLYTDESTFQLMFSSTGSYTDLKFYRMRIEHKSVAANPTWIWVNYVYNDVYLYNVAIYVRGGSYAGGVFYNYDSSGSNFFIYNSYVDAGKGGVFRGYNEPDKVSNSVIANYGSLTFQVSPVHTGSVLDSVPNIYTSYKVTQGLTYPTYTVGVYGGQYAWPKP